MFLKFVKTDRRNKVVPILPIGRRNNDTLWKINQRLYERHSALKENDGQIRDADELQWQITMEAGEKSLVVAVNETMQKPVVNRGAVNL
jgi:hypothetical protein